MCILSDWRTPPGSPWERNEDTTFDSSSLSWDTDDIAPRDDVTVPDAWDEGEETADEIWTTRKVPPEKKKTTASQNWSAEARTVDTSSSTHRPTTRKTSRIRQQKKSPVTVIKTKETLAMT